MSRFQRTHDGQEQRVTTLELFYDLVFVFAITQVSHLLLEHLTWEGAGQAALVLLVVWWSWNYTTWVTNELDPDSIAVRLLLIGLMLASFLMAVAIPEAFGDRALLFAGAYVAIQVGRHTFLTFAAAGPGSIERVRASRILIWFLAAGVLWIAGALAEGPLRTLLWLAALAIDYGGPLVTFRVPGLEAGADVGLAARDRALRGALPAVRDPRARRVDRDHRRDPVGRGARRGADRRVLARVPQHGGDVVAVLRLCRDDRAAPAGARREPHPDGARRLHLPARRAGRGRDRRRRRRRARDRPPPRRAAHGARSSRSSPAPRSTSSRTSSSGCGWPARSASSA